MKKTLITLVCAAITPVAFAQTSSTTTTQSTDPATGTTQTTTATTSTDGTVTTFEPGRTIVLRRVGVTDPVSYTLGQNVRYVNKAGEPIEASTIHLGVPVHVYYSGEGSTQTVTQVVVDQ